MVETVESFEVRRDDLRATRLTGDPRRGLGNGQALLQVDRFGLTANNITYGVAGDMIGYWGFFPASEGWGRIPAWGFADVVASEADGVAPGTRVFGYLPMSSHVVVVPTRVSPHGFIDGASHRAGLPGLYNRYTSSDSDPIYRHDTEDLQAIFFPLFVTSFVIDDFLSDNNDFGADRIVLSSASSKTAAGTALCISRRSGVRPAVVGLTSVRHVAFVEGLGWYDEVVAYDDVASLDPSPATVLVDIAGSAAVRRNVHSHLGDRLMASSMVGMTHWETTAPPPTELPGPKPAMFFAPAQIDKRVTEWGVAGYRERLGGAWARLLDVVPGWVDIIEVAGLDALEGTYLRMVDGATDPGTAFIVALPAS